MNEVNKTKNNNGFVYLCVAVLLAFTILVLAFKVIPNKNKKTTRTIMIYMVGADLETKSGLATIDLDSIKYDKMDSENINVVLIAGGAQKWNNTYIDGNETSVYELKDGGFKKVKKNKVLNMGDSKVFSSFLNYVYNHYKTDKYDLIFWNHGGAIYGSEFDDLSHDFLSLDEMRKGFNSSPFKDEKLETIIFRTCLNGTLEVGTVLDDYADYLVASEETTIGTPFTSVLNFINDIETTDSGYDISSKFVEAYKKQVKDYKAIYNKKIGAKDGLYSTYSIVNLSNIKNLVSALNSFISDVDVVSNYNNIAKVRSNLYQYAYTQAEEPSYDMVDLYNLIDKIKDISPKKANKVLDEFEKTVVYNWATNNNSRGISIYFPYNGNSKYKTLFMKIYNDFDELSDYRKFIFKFAEIQHSSTKRYSFTKNITKVESKSDKNADFTLELTDEQKDGYANAEFLVFQGNENDEYYRPIYRGKNVKLNGNTLSASIKGRQLRVKSKTDSTDKGLVFPLFENTETDNYLNYNTFVVLGNLDKETLKYKSLSANMKITLNKNTNNVFVSSIIETEKNKNELKVDNVAVNINDYKKISFGSSKYNLIDKDGNYNTNFKSNGIYEGVEYDVDEFEFELEDFEKDSNYYCVFIIKDINNNTYFSKIVKMN